MDEESNEKEASSVETSSIEYDEQAQQENRERVQKIIDQMSDEELHRYEAFRRAAFNKNGIRKIVNSVLNQSCNPNFIIAVGGVAKVFIGEMIELAKDIQKEWKDEGALKPSHIHEAYRRLYKTMPHLKAQNKNPFF